VNEELFKARTRKLALDIIGLVESLSRGRTADVIGRQLLRSGTSIGANYRAACRGKSKADVISKLAIVEEEADETIYWMELHRIENRRALSSQRINERKQRNSCNGSSINKNPSRTIMLSFALNPKSKI